jgi:hypothetical protein
MESVWRLAVDLKDAPPSLARLIRIFGDQDFEAEPALKAALCREWDGLPAAEKSRILKGWSHFGTPCSRAENDLMEAGAVMTRYLCVSYNDGGGVWADQDWYKETGSTVRVMIADGTDRKEVVAALRRMVKLVETRWSDLIAMTPAIDYFPVAQQKSGMPQAPEAQAVKQKSNEALTAAAALPDRTLTAA